LFDMMTLLSIWVDLRSTKERVSSKAEFGIERSGYCTRINELIFFARRHLLIALLPRNVER
jgi:hypothetical protein